MPGFTINNSNEYGYSSYSFYSTDKDLVDEMAKFCKDIVEKNEKSKDLIVNNACCEFIDEMNEWNKLFDW